MKAQVLLGALHRMLLVLTVHLMLARDARPQRYVVDTEELDAMIAVVVQGQRVMAYAQDWAAFDSAHFLPTYYGKCENLHGVACDCISLQSLVSLVQKRYGWTLASLSAGPCAVRFP